MMQVTQSDRDKAIRETKQDVLSGMIAVSGGLALSAAGAGPFVVGVASASGPALKLVGKLGAKAVEERTNRAGVALDLAAEIMDVGLEILEERAAGYNDRLELLARVLEAAGRSPLQEKVPALAQVLADGLRPDGDVGLALVLAAALADLEAPHVSVLHLVSVGPVPPEKPKRIEHHGPGWTTSDMSQAYPAYASIMDGLTAVLTGHGLLINRTTVTTIDGEGPFTLHSITSLGQQCLMLLGHLPPAHES